jgi:hypothetical protein
MILRNANYDFNKPQLWFYCLKTIPILHEGITGTQRAVLPPGGPLSHQVQAIYGHLFLVSVVVRTAAQGLGCDAVMVWSQLTTSQ